MNTSKFSKVLALFLALITIISLIPPNIVIAEERSVAITSMEVGKLYTAELQYGDVYLYADPDGTEMYKEYGYETTVTADRLPDKLYIVLQSSTDSRVYITNEDLNPIFDGYRYLDPMELKNLKVVEQEEPEEPENPDEGLIRGEVDLRLENNGVVEGITIGEGEKTYIFTKLSDEVQGASNYRWQLLVNREKNIWADVPDYVYPYAPISEALICNAIVEDGAAVLRCIVTKDGKYYVTEELKIQIDPDKMVTEVPVYNNSEDDFIVSVEDNHIPTVVTGVDVGAFQVAIEYIFRHATAYDDEHDGSTAAKTFTVSLTPESSYSGKITSPAVAGYLPYMLANDAKNYFDQATLDKLTPITYDGKQYYPANVVEFKDVTKLTTVTVYYIPQLVNFTVKYYQQKVNSDEYVQVDSVVISDTLPDCLVGIGKVEDKNPLSSNSNWKIDYDGFEALYHDPYVTVNGDNSTVVEIYYDRIYYLVDFDLNSYNSELNKEEAYGASPYYVRYDTQVLLPSPTYQGYSFLTWTGNDSNTYPSGTIVTVRDNLFYTASWNKSTSYYTIVYWLEDPNTPGTYNVWYSYKVSDKTTGSSINSNLVADNITSYIKTSNGFTSEQVNDVTKTKNYITWVSNTSDKTKYKSSDTVVKGDGSSTVNIYYDRNSYTLRFYYAFEKVGSGSTKSTYYVIGGSSNYFGSLANTTTLQTNPVEAIKQYLTSGTNANTQLGEVADLPTLNTVKYTDANKGAEQTTLNSSSYKLHYLTFTAKYGADISDLWPCNVFNSVTTKSNHDWNQSDQATASAWNGEYNVKYTQDHKNDNQTIKGKYQILDENLLWSNMSTNSKTTVSYVCFWENGRNTGSGWSIPKLFRYKIWLPIIPGEEYATTVEHEGITYYLADCYDTCDDSKISQQTQPSLKGFKTYEDNGSPKYLERVGTSNLYNYNNYDSIKSETWAKFVSQTEFNEIIDSNSDYRKSYKDAYIVNFFYTRNKYDFILNNGYSTKTETVYYGESLTGYDSDAVYPAVFEPGEKVFAGWYKDQSFNNEFDFNTTMPEHNVQIYSKWDDVYYSVKVYLDSSKTVELTLDWSKINSNKLIWDDVLGTYKIVFGEGLHEAPSYTSNPEYLSKYKNYTHAGWYYIDENGDEKAFHFEHMTIKANMEIYAKWTSMVPVEYTVYYVIKDGYDYIQIADASKGISLSGKTKTFDAKIEAQLYKEYQVGYFPTVRKTTILMNEIGDNIFYFEYEKRGSIDYTIAHEFISDKLTSILGTNTVSFEDTITIDDADKESAYILVNFKSNISKNRLKEAVLDNHPGITDQQFEGVWTIITELSPDSYEKGLILTTEEENRVTFSWASRGITSYYQVQHYLETLDGRFVLDHTDMLVGTISNTVKTKANIKEFTGYEYIGNPPEGYITAIQFKSDGTIDESSGLILRVYYTLKKYNYQVLHYKVGETTPFATTTSSTPVKHGSVVKVSEVAFNEANGNKLLGYTNNNPDTIVEITSTDTKVYCYYIGETVYYHYVVPVDGLITTIVYETTVGTAPKKFSLDTLPEGYVLYNWTYETGDGVPLPVPDGSGEDWLSASGFILNPEAPPAEWAGKTITITANLVPTSIKIINNFTNKPSNETQGVVYVITGAEASNSSFSMRVIVIDTLTIYGLPVGEYNIDVEKDWSWRYDNEVKKYPFEIYKNTSETIELEFKLVKSNSQYITDQDYAPKN